jgi:GTP pyrophosphokinase
MSEKILKPLVESYNIDEEYLYNKTYLFIKGYAEGRNYRNTLKALPLARMMHDGQYRKGLQAVEVINHFVEMVVDDSIENNDGSIMKPVVKAVHETISVHLPYILHCLKVCSTLISLPIPLADEEMDILLTCALLHDTLEDCDEYFPKGGEEYVTEYGFPSIVGETIKLLSKNTGADEYELNFYFNNIKTNKFALLIKLADRSHNVEDLYNMKNIPKYIKETRDYIIGKNAICTYGKQNYPELSNAITVLKSKIISLTEATEVILEKQNILLEEKDKEIENLKKELAKYKKDNI